MAKATIKFTSEMIRYIGLFESLTGAAVKDCLIDENNRLIFVVEEGSMGLAIGKKGSNIKRLKKLIGRDFDILEFSKDPLQFLRNLLWPVRLQDVYLSEKSNGEKAINLTVPPKEKKILLSKKGEKIKRVKNILQRHYEIDEIRIR